MIVELFTDATPDHPVFWTDKPMEVAGDLHKLILRALIKARLSAGTYFNIHFVTKGGGQLLARGHFIVTQGEEQMPAASDDPYAPPARARWVTAYEPVGGYGTDPWLYTGEPPAALTKPAGKKAA